MYYIYELWNPVTNEPIYVGYGKHNRKASKLRHEDHLQEVAQPGLTTEQLIKKLN